MNKIDTNNKMLPLVSVIVPTYKRPNQIGRTIESVLKQTYSNIEIIVVDDNGRDSGFQKETFDAIKKYIENVKYIVHDINRGGSAARNTGWRKAGGKYITFLDDDDEIEPTKMEKQVECMERLNDEWGGCYTGYRLLRSDNSWQISSEKRSGDCYINALMRTMYIGGGSNLFLKKGAIDEIAGFDESFIRNQDIEFLVRFTHKYKLAYIDEILLTIHQDGVRKKRTFHEIDSYARYYLERFRKNIDELSLEDRERVIAVISLERFRTAIYSKKIIEGFRILKNNRVKLKYILRYVCYVVNRIVTHKSYGFDGR